jgi:hypothetical protein
MLPGTSLRHAVGVLFALSVCTAHAAEVPSRTFTVALEPTTTQLLFIEGRDAARMLADRRPPPAAADSAGERELVAYCSNGEPQRAYAEKGFITNIATAIVQLVIAQAAEHVRAELTKYSAMSEHTRRIDYYRGATSPATGARLESRYTCLRFTRLAVSAGGETEVALDFVAGIGTDTDGSAILLRPLRLYVNKALARSATGRYGVAIGVRAQAVWRDAVQGHEAVVFDKKITAEAIDLAARPFLTYYPTDPGGGQRLPIVPVSVDSDRSHDFGRVDLTVSVAETGAPPAILTLLAQWLPATPDHRTSLLLEAATALIQTIPGAAGH